jgi:hypothetical protein
VKFPLGAFSGTWLCRKKYCLGLHFTSTTEQTDASRFLSALLLFLRNYLVVRPGFLLVRTIPNAQCKLRHAACSLGLSATSQQYFSLRTNQPPATNRNQPAVLFSQNKPAPAISHQPTEQADDLLLLLGGWGGGDLQYLLVNITKIIFAGVVHGGRF